MKTMYPKAEVDVERAVVGMDRMKRLLLSNGA